MEGRIAKDLVEFALQVGRQGEDVSRHECAAGAVGGGILARQCRQAFIALNTGDSETRNARRKTQACGSRARSQLQCRLPCVSRHRRRQHHRVQAGAKSCFRLTDTYLSVKKRVGHIASGIASRSSFSARGKSSSSTIRRRGRKPMLPSITLACVSKTTDLIPSCSNRLAAKFSITGSRVLRTARMSCL